MKAFLVVAVLALVCTTHAHMRGRDLGRIENSKERIARSAEAAAAAAPLDLGAELKALHAESAAAMAETDFEEELNNGDSSSGPVQAPGGDDKRNPPPPPSSPPLKDGVAPQIVDKIEKAQQQPNIKNKDGWTTVSSNHKAVKPPQAELDELDKHAGSLYDDIIADLDEMDYAVEPPTSEEKPADEEPAIEAPVEEKASEEIKKEDEESEAEKHEKESDKTEVVEVPRPVPMEPAQAYFVALHGGPPKAARPNYKCELCMMVMGRKMAGQNEDLCAGLTHEEDKVTCDHVIATMTAYDRYLVDWLYYEGCERYNPKKEEKEEKKEEKKEKESDKAAEEATAGAGEPTDKEEKESPEEEGADAKEVADAKAHASSLLQEAEDSNTDEAAAGAEEAAQDKEAEKEEAVEEAAEEGDADAAKDNDETSSEKDGESEWVVTIPCPPHALCSWMTMPGESSPFCDINVTKYRRTERFYEKHVIPLQKEEKGDEAEAAKGDKAAEENEPSTQEAKEGEKEEAAEGAKESAAPDETGNHAAPEQPIPDEPAVDAPTTEAEAEAGKQDE